MAARRPLVCRPCLIIFWTTFLLLNQYGLVESVWIKYFLKNNCHIKMLRSTYSYTAMVLNVPVLNYTSTLQKKKRFPLRISLVNITKSAENCGFIYIYWRNPWWKTSFFCAVAECNTKLILNLKPFYDCDQPLHLEISGYPSLKNCSHSVLQQEAHISTFCGKSFNTLQLMPPSQSTTLF